MLDKGVQLYTFFVTISGEKSMVYVFWLVLFLIIFRVLKSKLGEGAGLLRENIKAMSARQDGLVTLLERLYSEGYIFGESALDATYERPKLVSHTGLANMLDDLSEDYALEKVLPRIGFTIRTLAACEDLAFVKQYTRILVTPGNYGIGYGAR